MDVAALHAPLRPGDSDDAARLLQQAFSMGATHGVGIHREPAFDGMWGYAAFEALVAPR